MSDYPTNSLLKNDFGSRFQTEKLRGTPRFVGFWRGAISCRARKTRFKRLFQQTANQALARYPDRRREIRRNSVSQPGIISGPRNKDPRDRRGAHKRWWKGPWKNRRRYPRCNSTEKQRGPSTRSVAPQGF